MDDKSESSSSASPTKNDSGSSTKQPDVYEFKTGNAGREGPSRTGSPTANNDQAVDKPGKESLPAGKEDKKSSAQQQPQAGDKRGHDNEEDDEARKKKQRREDNPAGAAGPISNLKEMGKSVRGTRGGSTEKVLSAKVGGAKARALVAADQKSPLSMTNSPKKAPSRDHSDDDDDDSKKSTDSSGLKVPPLKIVLTNQGTGGSNGSGSGMSASLPNSEVDQKKSGAAELSQASGPESLSTSSITTYASSNVDKDTRPSSSYTDYHVKKRKLRSQVDESASSGGGNGNNTSGNSNSGPWNSGPSNSASSGNGNSSSGCAGVGTIGGNGNRNPSEPLNDIEKYLNIRRQVEQRRKNLFPVQPKPPQGFKDYLMNRKTYLLHENAPERLRSIPMIQPPQSLDGPLRELFKAQEEERYKLRMKHLVEKEKLVLAVEQEILRVHGRAARALANQSLPFSVCTFLRDEEIYTPIDPQQEEKNRDIRSRYNGRLFLSWLQDVDDKWEKIKEQMVLRHHNEAESLNAVQKMDWEWKLKELSSSNPVAHHSDLLTPIDDLHIPMVHVSDDFDLDRS